ncbi:MAG: CHASE4 domain-containing protein [Methanomassiliicoccales archaeon]
MRLRTRVLATVAIIMVTFSLLLLVTATSNLQHDYDALERGQQERDMGQGMGELNNLISSLRTASLDYSIWDDTYAFAIAPGQAYVDSNLVNTTYQSFALDLIIISNRSGVIYSGEYDALSEQVLAPSPQLVAATVEGITSMSVPPPGGSGLVEILGQRYIISYMPILLSSGAGPSQGWFIAASPINDAVVTRLSTACGFPVSFKAVDARLSPGQVEAAQSGLMVPLLISGQQAVLVTGLHDLGGRPLGLYEMGVNRDIYQRGQAAIGLLWQSIALVAVALTAIFLVLMHLIVIRRIEDLDQQVGAASEESAERRMDIGGHDEISHLASSINGMLVSIETGYQHLGDEKRRYHHMIDVQDEAIARLDQDLRIIIHNTSLATLAVRRDVEGRDFFASMGLEEGSLREDLKSLQEGGPSLCAEFKLPGPGGTHYQRWTFAALFALPKREYQVIGQDVTLMKQSEEELAQYRSHLEQMVAERTQELSLVNATLQEEIAQRTAAEGRYRGVVEDQTELVFRFQLGGEITFSNTAYRLFNGDQEWLALDAVGEETLARALGSIIAGNELAQVEVEARSQGRQRRLAITMRGIFCDGVLKEVQAVARDVTEKEQLEKERTRTQQMEWLGIISAALAHEINNQMTAALGKIRLAEKTVDLGEAQALLHEAEQSMLRSGRTTRRLLAFARGAEPLRESVRVQDLLEMAADSSDGPRQRIAVEDEGGSVHVDPAQMPEALAAIINDGLEASAPAGMVRISARWKQETLEIRIKDEGRGMPPEVLARAFEPFFTTHEGRAGLGLSTVALIGESWSESVVAVFGVVPTTAVPL